MIIKMAARGVHLSDWNIFLNTTTDTEHFVGYDNTARLGRVSTPIESYDLETGIGITESGSIYQTLGAASQPHDDAIYVLESIIRNRLKDYKFKYPLGE